jgi:hypothetical protein
MKLQIMQFSQASRHFISFGPNILKHPVLKHPQSVPSSSHVKSEQRAHNVGVTGTEIEYLA